MHVSTMVRRTLALIVATTAIAACSDVAGELAAPPSRTVKFQAGADLQIAAARYANDARGNSASNRDDQLDELTFTVDPRVSRTYAFGRNWIYFPDYSICDPATSTYGLGTWDTPCEPLRKPIQVTVRWKHRGGHGYVEFEPDLRFVPSSSLRDWVILAIYDRKPLDSEDYAILWDAPNGKLIDESRTDPTLRAYVDRHDNTVYRRIKHFSGYMIAAGFTDLGGLAGDGGFYNAP
jgi:hypothetical protein